MVPSAWVARHGILADAPGKYYKGFAGEGLDPWNSDA